jgi:hypothetical protein
MRLIAESVLAIKLPRQQIGRQRPAACLQNQIEGYEMSLARGLDACQSRGPKSAPGGGPFTAPPNPVCSGSVNFAGNQEKVTPVYLTDVPIDGRKYPVPVQFYCLAFSSVSASNPAISNHSRKCIRG